MKTKNLIKILVLLVALNLFLSAFAVAQGKQQKIQMQQKFQTTAQLVEEIKKCKANESDWCKDVRAYGIEVAKTKIIEVFEAKIERLNELKEKIEKNEDLSSEEKKIILERIDKLIAKLEILKQNLPDNATQLRQILQEYRENREKFNEEYGIIKEKIGERRVGLIVERAEHLVKKLERFIEKYNATDLENLTQKFYEKIQKANESRNEAIALWKELQERIKNKNITSSEIREYIKKIHEKLEEAKSNLKEANKILKEILKEIREIKEKEKVNKNETIE